MYNAWCLLSLCEFIDKENTSVGIQASGLFELTELSESIFSRWQIECRFSGGGTEHSNSTLCKGMCLNSLRPDMSTTGTIVKLIQHSVINYYVKMTSWRCLTCWPVKLWRRKMMSLVNKSADWTPNYHKILIFSPPKSLKRLRAARIDQLADSNEPATRDVYKTHSQIMLISAHCERSQLIWIWIMHAVVRVNITDRILITARKRSLGKVMFLQLSVSHSVHRGSLSLVPFFLPGDNVCVSGSMFFPGESLSRGSPWHRTSSRQRPLNKHPLVRKERAVCILLECILVFTQVQVFGITHQHILITWFFLLISDNETHPDSIFISLDHNPFHCDSRMCWIKQGVQDGWLSIQYDPLSSIVEPDHWYPDCTNYPDESWDDVDLECDTE